MPAEIDTGGPTVLHCDYRADCPIPIVLSVLANEDSTSNHEGSAAIRPVGSSFARRRLPKIDESKHPVDQQRIRRNSYRKRREEAHQWKEEKILSDSKGSDSVESCELRESAKYNLSHLSPCSRVSHQNELSQSEISDEHDHKTATTTKEGTLSTTCFAHRLSSTDETKPPNIDWFSCIRVKPDPTATESYATTGFSTSRERSARSSGSLACSETTRVQVGTPLFSSHRSHAVTRQRTSREEQAGACRSSAIDEGRSGKSERLSGASDSRPVDGRTSPVATIRRRNSRKSSGASPERKTRSYAQLVLLLFLVLLGQNGISRSSVLNSGSEFGVRGFALWSIGALISMVNAAPLDLIGDAGTRAERSANLSHITGASRKIQMYIKNRHLQILPDGTVNGSNDDTSEYTIFQRTSVSRGQLRIQGVATCLYLCMDSCGLLYGSREYTEDCVFNETLEQHNYNTYSSVRWSTAKKTLYLGLNRHGQPRRVQAKGHNLGRLSAYARVLTQMAPPDRVEALQRRMLGAEHGVRHRHSGPAHHHHRAETSLQQTVCPTLPAQEKDGRDRFRCRKRKKRKKRKRRCRLGEKPSAQCEIPENATGSPASAQSQMTGAKGNASPAVGPSLESKRSCEGAASEEACRREALSTPSRKRKSRIESQKKNPTKTDNVELSEATVFKSNDYDAIESNITSNSKNSTASAAESVESSKKPCERGANEENCKRGGLSTGLKKRKSRIDDQRNPSARLESHRTKPVDESAAVGQSDTEGDVANEEEDSSNGKNKTHEARSSAKKPKLAVAGSNSQSKKPDLTDGKKRKRKGTASRGSGSWTAQRQNKSAARKRLAPGEIKDQKDDSRAATDSTVRPLTASSSSWPRAGASSGPSARHGKLALHRRRIKASSSPRNDVTSTSSSGRTVGHTLFLGPRGTADESSSPAINRPANTTHKFVSSTASYRDTLPILNATRHLPTTKVPATLPDHLSSDGSSLSVVTTSLDADRNNHSGAHFPPTSFEDDVMEDEDEEDEENDDNRSTMFSNDYTTGLVDPTANDSTVFDSTEDLAVSATIGTVALDETSIENIEDEDDDTLDSPKATPSASAWKFPLERLAM